jgi:intein/homing endonuclease
MAGTSWYETGFSGAEREAEKKELGDGPQTFWLKPGENRELVLIDDNPFCFPAGTMVSTEDGAKSIEQIVVGDIVRSSDGKTTTVVDVLPTVYEGNMVKIRAQSLGEDIVCTEDHPFAVVKGKECKYKNTKGGRRWCIDKCATACATKHFEDYSPAWVKASDIEIGDYLLIPVNQKIRSSSTIDEIVMNHPRFIGLFIAEGHIRLDRGEIGISLHEEEKELQELAVSSLKLLGCKTVRIDTKESKEIQVIASSKVLAQKLAELCGVGANNKHFPKGTFSAPREILVEMTNGYFEGDGWLGLQKKNNRASIGTVSRELAYQIKQIIMVLGGKPIMQVNQEVISKDGVHHQTAYFVSWNPLGDGSNKLDWLPADSRMLHRAKIESSNTDDNEKIAGDYMWAPVYKTEKFNDTTEVYNLTCQPSNTFVANNVAVHNCFWAHEWRTAESFAPHTCTCTIKSHEECAACSNANVGKAEYVGHLTAVDCTGYTSKDGTMHKFDLVEFCPKTKVMNKFKNKKLQKTSLIGQMVAVTRTDNQSPRTGDDFEFGREVDMVKMYEVVMYKGKKIKDLINTANGTGPESAKARKFLCHNFQVPEEGVIPAQVPAFNYPVLHKPLEPAELRKAVVGAQESKFKAGVKGAATTSKADDDVPF